jgi:hypothetical protein
MQLQFDASRVEPNVAFEPLPAGWYTAMITDTGEKDTNDKLGKMLEVTLEIMGGDFNKRKVFDRLNLVNANPMAVDIAYRTLSAICHSVGVIQMTDTSQLHGKPLLVKVAFRPARTDKDTGKSYDASNEVKGYKAVDPNAPPVLGPPKSAQAGMALSAAPAWANGGQPAANMAQQPVQSAPQGWGAQQAAPQGYAPQGFQGGQIGQPQQAPQGFQQPAQVQAAPPAWAQPAQPQQFQPAQGFQQPAPNQAVQQAAPNQAAPFNPQQGFQAAPQQAVNTVPTMQQPVAQTTPSAPAGNSQIGPGTPPWQGQPAQNSAPPAAAPVQAPPAQGPGGTPPWQQGGQPGAQAAQTPPWQQGNPS